jgi:hypothetical protein
VSDRLSVERRGVSHSTFPVVGVSARCACTLNAFDTIDYGYLNAIRARALICPDFRNYVSSPRCVKKLDKSREFLSVDFLPSFLTDIWTLMGTIHSSLEAGKHTKVSFPIPDEPIFRRASTSLTSVGNDTGSPEPVQRPSPATDHAAEILDVDAPYVDYNAEQFSSQQAR